MSGVYVQGITQATCEAAEISFIYNIYRCKWENTQCLTRKCEEMQGLTDTDCSAQLVGCKSDGRTCVIGDQCSDFGSNEQFCLNSKYACVFYNRYCYIQFQCEMFPYTVINCVKMSLPCAQLMVQVVSQSLLAQTHNHQRSLRCRKSCKLLECGDAEDNNTTYEGCKEFTVASGSCTTDGQKCIPLRICSLYLVEFECVEGIDGTCTFALPVGTPTTSTTTVAKSCRQKQCSDIQLGPANPYCSGIIGMMSGKECVSNGVSCIPKAACSTYRTKSACKLGGVDSTGADVVCVFTANLASNIGTCKQFTQCSDANNDQYVCIGKSEYCTFQTETKGEVSTTFCSPRTCEDYNIYQGTDCQPVPSIDGLSYKVCVLVNGRCVEGDPGTISDPKQCYIQSAKTYSWNGATSKCQSCYHNSTSVSNTNVLNGANETNGSNSTNGNSDLSDIQTKQGNIFKIIILLGFFGFIV